MRLLNALLDDTASEKLKEFDKCGDVPPFPPPPGGTPTKIAIHYFGCGAETAFGKSC